MGLALNEFDEHPCLEITMQIFLLLLFYGSLRASCLLTACLFSSLPLSSSPALQQELLKP